INRRIETATGIPSTTTIEAVMAALRAARIRRLGLLTPYTDDVVRAETRFLADAGHTVAVTGGEPCVTPVEQGMLPPERWIEWAEPFAGKDIDGLLISCAGIRIAPVLQRIEDRLRRPVITSNQAVVWNCLRILDLADRPQGFGALLAGKFD
ncbi:MAG: aspartate/glutamate racemase family protein, partial [Alphaproteobacteria bacterium]